MKSARVLVTGGAGFIGSHLCEGLLEAGHSVAVVDNLCTGKRENLPRSVEFHEMDICVAREIEELFSKGKFQVVFHLAAQNDVRTSVTRPEFDAQVNIIGSLNLLKNCVTNKVEHFIFASTGGAIYGEAERLPVDETHPINPEAPYGITKYAVEHYLRYFAANSDLQTRALRLGNVYGPRQDPFGEAGVVAIFCGTMLEGRQCKLFGHGSMVRDYVYVRDVVEAFLSAMKAKTGVPLNISTGIGTSVNELFQALAEQLDYHTPPEYAPKRAGEIERIYLDASRAKEELGWEPKVTFQQGIADTAAWFRSRFAA